MNYPSALDEGLMGTVSGYTVTVGAGAAVLPENFDSVFYNAGLIRFESEEGSAALVVHTENAGEALTAGFEGALPEDASVTLTPAEESSEDTLFAFDITILDQDGAEWEPGTPVEVRFTSQTIGEAVAAGKTVKVLHHCQDGSVEELSCRTELNTVFFETDSFSVYEVVAYVLETTIDIEGQTYKVTATYDDRAGIPGDAVLNVSEMDIEDENYLQYLNDTAEALGVSAGELGYLRMLDISIVGEDGTVYKPNDQVKITVELMDDSEEESEAGFGDLHVIHFGEETEEISASTQGDTVIFTTDSFSVFSFADLTIVQNVVDAIFGSTYTNKIYENDDVVVSGNMPRTAIVEVNTAEVEIQDADVLVAYDIKIYAGLITKALGIAWQPTDGALTVQMKSDAIDVENVDVYHMENAESEAELIATEISVDNNSVTFQASSFSVYSVSPTTYFHTYKFYVPTDATQTTFEEYHIYTDAEGYTTFTQIIKDAAEGLVVPQLPSLQSNTNSTFAGWYLDTGDGSNIQTPTLSGTEFNFDNIPAVTSNQEYHLYARFANFAYVIFHEQYNGATSTWPITKTRRGELTGNPAQTSIVISDVTVSYDDSGDTGSGDDEDTAPAMAFRGWTLESGLNAERTAALETATIVSSPITISENTDLYPVFVHINWLTFISGPSGSGATYYAPDYFYVDEGVSSLASYIPTRAGYTFAGWYADQAYTKQLSDASGALTTSTDLSTVEGLSWSGGKLMLSKNVTIYAKWNPGTSVSYTVMYWKQNANDDDYVMAEYQVLTGTTDSLTSVTASDTRYDYFHLSADQDKATAGNQSSIQQQTISGNGSTVVNVYYDRNEYTLWFWIGARNGTRNVVRSSSGNWRANWKTEVPNYSSDTTHYRNWTSTTNPFTSSTYTIVSDTYNSYTYYYIKLTARYEEDLTDKWPTLGIGGVNTYKFNSWACDGNTLYRVNTGVNTIKGLFPTMSADIITVNGTSKTSDQGATNIFLALYATSNYDYTYNYYFWNPDTEAYPAIPDKTVSSAATTSWASATVADFEGYEFIEKTYGGDGNASGYGGTVNFYYKPLPHTLTFRYNSVDLGSDSYYYGESLADANKYTAAAEAAAPTGYSFAGWYENPDGIGASFDFSSEVMPNTNKVLYPKYNTQWYLIKINPNGGAYPSGSSYSTWFWKQYGTTELVIEYENTSRDYLEALNGTWYYAVQDRDYYGLTDEWDDIEDTISDRKAYYTQDISDPAIVDSSVRYKYVPDAFRYANWYEVLFDGSGNEIGERLYNFNTAIDHDMTLRLHWKQVGTYYIRYDAGVGTLDDQDNNEDTFRILDSSDYADHSDVVVTRVAHPPERYNFVGWQIRGGDGTVYFPGQAFEFNSKYCVTIGEKDVLILDAVYTRVSMATIVYDANGGSIDTEIVDYGGPTALDAPEVTTTATASQATITNLINNSQVKLSTGAGFSMTNATLTGWNTEADASGTHYDLFDPDAPEYFNVDTEEPITLYAEWKVKVYYDLSQDINNYRQWPAAWASDSNYTYVAENNRYYEWAYVGSTVSQPPYTPTSTNPTTEMFYFWYLDRYDQVEDREAYDFSTPITGETILFANWNTPVNIKVHAVDATVEDLSDTAANKDADWLVYGTSTEIQVISGSYTNLETAAQAAAYATNVPSGYEFAFACIATQRADCTEMRQIKNVYYDITLRKPCVTFMDDSTAALVNEEIYLVYFQNPRTLNIGYKIMSTSGVLSDATMGRSGYPTTASAGTYAFGDFTDARGPKYYANQTNYAYYSYAVGEPGATSASQLQLITNSSGSDSSRPDLRVKNTWRGFQYSADGGSTWVSCGYDVQLYVIYFASQPTIVTLTEQTFGTAADMSEEFTYTVQIQSQVITTIEYSNSRTGSSYIGYNYTTQATQVTNGALSNVVSPFTVELADGESQTITLFDSITTGNWSSTNNSNKYYNGQNYNYIRTTTETVQIITITQTQKSGFDVDNTSTGGTKTSQAVWTYTTTSTAATPSVTYTNTHKPISFPVHVAVMIDGNLVNSDSTHRSSTAADYIVTLSDLNASADLVQATLPNIFTGDSNIYAFAGIVYGTQDSSGNITAAGVVNAANSVTYGNISGRIYEMYLNGSTSLTVDAEDLNENYNIYFVYYEMPKIYYMLEAVDGTLTQISPIERNGLAVTLNGATVTQGAKLNVGTTDFVIAQSGSGTYRIPQDLDSAADGYLFFDYVRLAVGPASVSDTGDLEAVATNKAITLKVIDSQVKYSLDGGATWNVFQADPTVYAIYKEKGYELRITKTVTGDFADSIRTFTLTVSSDAITESSYNVHGTGYSTVSATPATASTPGTIVLTISAGSDITIYGLARGTYTLTESDGAVMSATIDGVSQTVTDNSMTITDMHANTRVDITNEMKAAAPSGVSMQTKPFIWMSLAGILLFAGLFVPAYLKKRKREDEE